VHPLVEHYFVLAPSSAPDKERPGLAGQWNTAGNSPLRLFD
jgi:hypothetical protein